MRLLVTGGAGFIGSAVVRQAIANGHTILNLDALTYASCLANVESVSDNNNYRFVHADIRDRAAVSCALQEFGPEIILHLAAETHVDRSIDGPMDFVETNVVGTATLLDVATSHWIREGRPTGFRFIHVSTDEVFGSLGETDKPFNEASPYDPSSPYAASKASADHLVRAWQKTYGLPTIITNCSNNYGPYQFPEKLIPVTLLNAISDRQIPVYGDGLNVRDWLHVEDHAMALLLVAERGEPSMTYAIGGNSEATNIDIIQMICDELDVLRPGSAPSARLITFVEDRPGHDRRYAINDARIRQDLGWSGGRDLHTGIRQTVRWYLENESWLQGLRDRDGVGTRLGHGQN